MNASDQKRGHDTIRRRYRRCLHIGRCGSRSSFMQSDGQPICQSRRRLHREPRLLSTEQSRHRADGQRQPCAPSPIKSNCTILRSSHLPLGVIKPEPRRRDNWTIVSVDLFIRRRERKADASAIIPMHRIQIEQIADHDLGAHFGQRLRVLTFILAPLRALLPYFKSRSVIARPTRRRDPPRH